MLLCGVPGEVRTHNLPLRRGMLYPIELLGHAGGSMLATIGSFVMPAPLIKQQRPMADHDSTHHPLHFA